MKGALFEGVLNSNVAIVYKNDADNAVDQIPKLEMQQIFSDLSLSDLYQAALFRIEDCKNAIQFSHNPKKSRCIK